jgi:hypothetical protein
MKRLTVRLAIPSLVAILTLLVWSSYTMASNGRHIGPGLTPTLPHKLDAVGVTIAAPSTTSHLTDDEAVKAALTLLPTPIPQSAVTAAAKNYGLVMDGHEFQGGIHAWIVSFDVDQPHVVSMPGDGNSPPKTLYGHTKTIDVVVDDRTGIPLRTYSNGIWDKIVICHDNLQEQCDTQYLHN